MTRLPTLACVVLFAVSACSNETRTVTADLPQTPPKGAGDPRIDRYQQNAYQLAQGGRYYVWYGCGDCHSGGDADLGRNYRRHGDGFDEVYASIAHGHAGTLANYGQRIPVEQLWQITAYVRNLPMIDPELRRRQDFDAAAEPHDRHGPGAFR